MAESFYGNVINHETGITEIQVEEIVQVDDEENNDEKYLKTSKILPKGKVIFDSGTGLGITAVDKNTGSICYYHTLLDDPSEPAWESNELTPGSKVIMLSHLTSLDRDEMGHVLDYSQEDTSFDLVGGYGEGEEYSEIFNDYSNNIASGSYSHAEGQETQVIGIAAHAEGYLTQAEGDYTHVEGKQNLASGKSAHSEGQYTQALGEGSHAEGCGTNEEKNIAEGRGSHAEGLNTQATGEGSHAEGKLTIASGLYSHAEGYETEAIGKGAHAEGSSSGNPLTKVVADGLGAHAEGLRTLAQGNGTHAEGCGSQAIKNYAHAEGFETKAQAPYSHAEGYASKASGAFSHSQGNNTEASGSGSFASGLSAEAKGNYSFAQGNGVIANSDYSVALGQYNYTEDPNRIFQIGWGSNKDNRKDIMYLTKNGGLYAEEFYNSSGETLTSIRNDLKTTKENLKFNYKYDEVKQELNFYQGGILIGTVNVPINAVVNSARVLEGTTQLELTVNVENESGEIYPKSLIIDFGKVALDQMLLGDTDTIELFQNVEDGLQKICGNIRSGSIKGGNNGHLSTTPGSRIQEVNLDDSVIKTRSIADGAITNSKLSIINPETREGAAVNTNNLFDKAITSEKIEDLAITTNKIIDEAVETNKIKDKAITSKKIADKVIKTEHIVDKSITEDKLAYESVYTESIINGAITEEKLGTTVIENINGKLDMKDPVGTGTFSFNRLANSAAGDYSTTFGSRNTASGMRSFAIGVETQALGQQSFVTGSGGIAQGQDTHVEGRNGLAIGTASHVEGVACSTGDASPAAHAEGNSTQANASYAHAEGYKTIATRPGQHVQGILNIEDNQYLHIVGNGQQEYKKDGVVIREETRSNAHTLDYSGNAWFAGSVDCTKLYLRSSTPGSTKRFQITINDNGDLSIKEV